MSPNEDHRSEVRRRSGWRSVASWLTSNSIAGDTEAERSSERNRRAIVNSIAGLALRGSSFVLVLLSVPLTLDLLGPIRFGLWMTIASVIALLGVTDLGIGNGVLNSVAQAYGRGDGLAARRYLASGLTALGGIALASAVVFAAVYPIVPWAKLYNVGADPLAASEAGPATAVFVATFLIGMPLSLVGQVRAAYQEGFVQSAFLGLGNVLTIALLLLAVAASASLPVLVLAMAIGPIIAAAINLMVLVRIQRRWLAPHARDITPDVLRSVVRVGLAFMVLQIAYAVAFSTDRLIVAHVVGPAAVADYSVVSRLFSIPAGLAAIALVPLWPAYREAISRHDIAWVRLMLRRSLRGIMLVIIPLALVLVVVGPVVVAVWTNQELDPTHGLYFAFAAFTIAYAIANTFGMVLNGAQVLRYLIATWSLMAILNFSLSFYLASRLGTAGVAVGSVIAVVAALIVPALIYMPRLLRRLERGDYSSVVVTTTGPIALPPAPEM
jgi:O-antigen/teichoic acid export membrane protein